MEIQSNAFANMIKYVIMNIENTRLFSVLSELGKLVDLQVNDCVQVADISSMV